MSYWMNESLEDLYYVRAVNRKDSSHSLLLIRLPNRGRHRFIVETVATPSITVYWRTPQEPIDLITELLAVKPPEEDQVIWTSDDLVGSFIA